MKSFLKNYIEKLEEMGMKVASLLYMTVLKDSLAMVMPIIIVGSIGSLFSNVVCSTTNGLARFAGFEWLNQFSSIFSVINYAGMNMLAVYLALAIGYNLAQKRGQAELIGALVAFLSFVILIPTSTVVTAAESQETVIVSNILLSKYTSSQGMFLAILVSFSSVEIFSKLSSVKALQIKMPESVPTGISRSFSVLVPLTITAIIYGILGWSFTKIVGINIPDAIYNILQAPMVGIMQHPAGVIVLVFICQLFWMIGIHGSSMIEIVRNTIGLAAIAENLAAYEAGNALPNIFTYTFWNTYCTIGGCGCTIALIAAILLFGKKEEHRAIAKMSLIPGIFGINEPMIFGLPIVFDPILGIPFILAPMASAAIGYIAIATGFAGAGIVTVPFTVPPIINAYLTTAGSMGAVIAQIVGIIVAFLIYIPFVKIANQRQSS